MGAFFIRLQQAGGNIMETHSNLYSKEAIQGLQ